MKQRVFKEIIRVGDLSMRRIGCQRDYLLLMSHKSDCRLYTLSFTKTHPHHTRTSTLTHTHSHTHTIFFFHPVAAEEKKKRQLAEEELNSSQAEKLPGGTAVAAGVFADKVVDLAEYYISILYQCIFFLCFSTISPPFLPLFFSIILHESTNCLMQFAEVLFPIFTSLHFLFHITFWSHLINRAPDIQKNMVELVRAIVKKMRKK